MQTTRRATQHRGLRRLHTRARLLAALETERLLVSLTPGVEGNLHCELREWVDYWRPVRAFASREISQSLDSLELAWRNHIQTGFAVRTARQYCLRYFELLEDALNTAAAQGWGYDAKDALATVLGFECFGLRETDGPEPYVAAATTSLRNPCYLLQKLVDPSRADNAQYLPMIAPRLPGKTSTFWNYRQHRLSTGSGNSLLLYSGPEPDRSFPVINNLQRAMGCGADPWVAPRSSRLAERLIAPYLRAQHLAEGLGGSAVELVDIGGGSGKLLAAICHRISKKSIFDGIDGRFRVWTTEVSPGSPRRFFGKGLAHRAIETITSTAVDYRRWLDKPKALPPSHGIRIALISRVADTFSKSSIARLGVSDYAHTAKLPNVQEWWPHCLPHDALDTEGNGVGALRISCSRIPLKNGRSFSQASLSRYYQGLHILFKARPDSPDSKGVYIPLRSFCHSSLQTNEGRSIVSVLLKSCDLIIIEDADLTPSDLMCHLRKLQDTRIAALNMTGRMRLNRCFSYAIMRKGDPALSVLQGDPISWN